MPLQHLELFPVLQADQVFGRDRLLHGHGGLRPFGVTFLYAGWDPRKQFQLYHSNPSGNYGGWKATSSGANHASAQSLLKQDYKEDCTLKEACGMAVKVLSKTMDSTKLSSEKSACQLGTEVNMTNG